MRVLIGILGQSNEYGPGPATDVSRVFGAGGPTCDPIGPVGGNNSPWPHLAQAAGQRGHWYAFRNHAIGSTALCDVWVGRCRAYAINMVVAPGSYVLDGGNIYKAIQATYAPYTLNVAPSSGVGTSGLTSWTNLGAVQAGDTDGAIYAEGSARFDPNGKIAGIYSDIGTMGGFDRKAVFVSIGQGDKALSSSASQYSAAMQSVANYFTSRGIYVFLGMTCYGATAGLDAWYASDLTPGRLAALAALSSNPLVLAGCDWRTTLGVLTDNATMPSPGLQSDHLHMNAAAMVLAGKAWDATLAAAGW